MDENMTPEVEESIFDEEWGDAPVDDEDFDLGADEESGEEEPVENEETEAEGTENAETESEPEPEPAENQRSWKLKHNGEEVDADEAKMVELAQKGLDYDRVRGERDTFKNEHPKYADYEKFLGEMAESAGTDVPGLIESVRASLLVKKAEAEGKTMSEAAAIQQVRKAKAEEKTPEQAEAEKRQDTIRRFVSSHPEVKAEDIPQDVLVQGMQTGDLAGAYDRWEIKQLKGKLGETQKELETIKQNQKNKERSTGSRRSVGAPTQKDDFDDAWDSF